MVAAGESQQQQVPTEVQQAAVGAATDMAAAQAQQQAVAAVQGGKGNTPPMDGLKKAHSDAVAWMYKPHGSTVDGAFSSLEQYFGMQREYLAYAAGVVWLLYMVMGGGAHFLSNLIGFVYPCYASVLAIRTEGTADDTQWLIYWTTFGSFFLIDAFAASVMQWFPFYFVLKSAFLVYLWLPQTQGAQYLYVQYVDPAFTYIEKNLLSKYA